MTSPEKTLEDVYDDLARGIDAVGREAAEIYLAKVCLALAHELGDAPRACRIAAQCRTDLEDRAGG